MLQSLLSLSDSEIDLVTSTVSNWCSSHGHDINSERGRTAMLRAINAVQASGPEGIDRDALHKRIQNEQVSFG